MQAILYVVDTCAKIRNFKQITTTFRSIKRVDLLLIPVQRYEILSKSQLKFDTPNIFVQLLIPVQRYEILSKSQPKQITTK